MTLYTRAGCCLCEDAKQVLAAGAAAAWTSSTKKSISTESRMAGRYNDEVPVIAIDGRKAFKYRVAMDEFLKRLEARA